ARALTSGSMFFGMCSSFLTQKEAARNPGGFNLLIVDEMGFAPLDDTGTQLLFRLVAGAYERRSLAIASHWPFEQWGRFLPEHTTAVSILDRLLHHATTVITDGDSYRMTHRTEAPHR
ncbi:ATP-binding protein, partial [Gordonia sp. NPDC003376]